MGQTYSDMKQKYLILQRLKMVFENPLQNAILTSDDEQASVEIIKCADSPFGGVTSYSTLGVYRCQNLLTADDKELNVEFMGICDSKNNWFDGLLSTCAFAMIKGKVRAHPYEVYKNIIPLYQPNIDMKHILLIPPFSLSHELGVIETDDRVITWLMLNPISENEYVFMSENGHQKLTDAFVEADIDIYDLYRKSIF
ncbi:MAG: suppressor of fused domain protein [Eubacterium sp.]|nr:suppressor of fused domain protein [Eubacterium sp.]